MYSATFFPKGDRVEDPDPFVVNEAVLERMKNDPDLKMVVIFKDGVIQEFLS